MNGNQTRLWLLLGLAGALGLYWWTNHSESDSDSGGDESGSDPSGSLAPYIESIVEGLSTFGELVGIVSARGLRNNNPMNLRYYASIPWKGQVGPDDDGYAVFATAEDGCRAWGHQMRTYFSRGLNTLNKIIPTYAPQSENNTAAYIRGVANRTGLDPAVPFDLGSNILPVADAFIWQECGSQPFSWDQLSVWINEP